MSAIILGSGNNINPQLFFLEKINIEYVICADGGLNKAESLNIVPNIIIGDFDSVNQKTLKRYIDKNIEIIKYSSEKNYTDMELAIDYAVEKGFKDIILIGASGTRLDHTAANIILIEKYYKQAINIKIIDNNNLIQIVANNMTIPFRENYYVSIIPLSERIEGLTLEGFKYPLDNVIVERGSTLCISNEICENSGVIKLNKGSALVFISKD